jgi:hypothetical protein
MNKRLPKQNFNVSLEIKQAKELGKHLIDHLFTGGLIGLYDSLQLKKRLARFQESLSSLSEEVKNTIDEKVSRDYLNSEEYKEIMVKTVVETVALKNLTKIQYFRSCVINSMLQLDLEKNKKLFFLSSLSNLSDAALNVFISILKMYNKEESSVRHMSVGSLSDKLKIKDKEFLLALLRELDQFNFIEITWPQSKAFDQSNVAFDVRRLAVKFFDYITTYAEKETGENS